MSVTMLQGLVDDLEKNLSHYIVENSDKIKFNHSQYSFQQLPDGSGFEILITITGMGKQHLAISHKDGLFHFQGKILESTPDGFPFEILGQFLTGAVNKWIENNKVESATHSMDEATVVIAELTGPQ